MVIILKCRTCFSQIGCTKDGKTLFCEDCQTKFCGEFVFDIEYLTKCKLCI